MCCLLVMRCGYCCLLLLVQVITSRFASSSPALGSAWSVQSLLGILAFSSFSAPPQLVLFISLKMSKLKTKYILKLPHFAGKVGSLHKVAWLGEAKPESGPMQCDFGDHTSSRLYFIGQRVTTGATAGEQKALSVLEREVLHLGTWLAL